MLLLGGIFRLLCLQIVIFLSLLIIMFSMDEE